MSVLTKEQVAAGVVTYGTLRDSHEELRTRLAAMEAALDRLARLGNEPMLGNSVGNVIAQQALSGEPTALRETMQQLAGLMWAELAPARLMDPALCDALIARILRRGQ